MRILIADDNALVRKALYQLFEEQEGWSVCGEAQDGYEAVERAKQSRPDLIVLDLSMPHLSGLQAASRISALLPGTPMIMLTLYDSALVHTEAKKVGILQVIPKTDGASVIRTIKSVLQKMPVRDVKVAKAPTKMKSHYEEVGPGAG